MSPRMSHTHPNSSPLLLLLLLHTPQSWSRTSWELSLLSPPASLPPGSGRAPQSGCLPPAGLGYYLTSHTPCFVSLFRGPHFAQGQEIISIRPNGSNLYLLVLKLGL